MEEEWEGHVIEGVPGHVAWRGWARELQKRLRDYNVSYEAELDHTRIHLKGIVIQIYPEQNGYVIDASIPLPLGEEDPEYLEELMEGYRSMLLLISSAKGTRPEYELDTSLPHNPSLHTILFYTDTDTLLKVVEEFLKKYNVTRTAMG